MSNQQEIEKQELGNHYLEVHSIFFTIQGEGPFSGQPAIFIRLAGCNLKCNFCDTDYTSKREEMGFFSICDKIKAMCSSLSYKPLIVLTGGEPFRQNIGPLVRKLVSYGYKVQIETNGTLFIQDLPFNSITIVCSPKAGKVHPKLEPHIDAYKYVISHDSVNKEDGLPILALGHSASPQVARPMATIPIYLQPCDTKIASENKLNTKACVSSCLKFGYTMGVQVHKIIGVE